MTDRLPETDGITVHLEDEGIPLLTCPACGFQQTMEPSLIGDRLEFKVRCRCGHLFGVRVEHRRFYRKPVSLKGSFRNLTNGEEGSMRVTDLSQGGVRFEVLLSPRIAPGDTLEVVFRLDTPHQPEIHRRMQVITVHDHTVGGRFLKTAQYEAELGFYLLP